MANRRMFQFRYSVQRDIVDLTLKASIAAAGVPTLSTTDAKGIASITRLAAGQYRISLQDNYQALMAAQIVVLNATASAAPLSQLISEQVISVTAPQVVIQLLDAAGVAADPDDGATLLVHLMLRNAST